MKATLGSQPLKLIGPFRQLLSLANLPLSGPIKDSQLNPQKNAGILIQGKHIAEIDDFDSLLIKHSQAEVIKLSGSSIALPGFIDCHTHICHAGTRAKDFAMRNAGSSYLEISKAGGGIWDTVNHTRAASKDELVALTLTRAQKLIQEGITTIEVKSGYGLTIEEELKMLEAIQVANGKTEADLIATCLAAHIKPKDFLGNHEQYLQHIANDLFPILLERSLTKRMDAFIEEEETEFDIIRQINL